MLHKHPEQPPSPHGDSWELLWLIIAILTKLI